MKPFILLGTILAATVVFTACDPQRKPREKTAAHTGETKPADRKITPGSPELPPDGTAEPEKHPNVDVEPKHNGNVPPPPAPEKDEYAVKKPGKAGIVTDPHDPQGRELDVRGMPPGTKIESPWSHSILLVPPQ